METAIHRRRLHGSDGSDRPNGQKIVGAMLSSRPTGILLPLYTAKRYSKNYEFVIVKVKKR